MKALVKVGYSCNNRCTFCHTEGLRGTDGAGEAVHRKIERAAALGHTMVVLSGGEPTIRPELVDWAGHCAALGMGFGLVTNGRMLSYPALVRRLLRRRLRYVHLSLHAASAALHDRIVRAAAFHETTMALEALRGQGLDLSVNCVVTRANLDHLGPLVDLLAPFADLTLKLSLVEPKGAALAGFAEVAPALARAARAVRRAIEHGARCGLRVAHDGIPLCLLGGHEHLSTGLREHGFETMSEVHEVDLHPVDDGSRRHTPSCADCRLRGPCAGPYGGYADRGACAEVRAAGGPRPNSFHYVREEGPHARDLIWPAGDPCPVPASGMAPCHTGRHIFLRTGELLETYRTRTRDFSDADVLHTKRDLGQMYLDASAKAAVDDFGADVRALEPAKECARCRHAAGCPGCFVASAADPFAGDEARLAAILLRVEGDVLDVGCGHGRYAELLSRLAQDGRVRHTGVEPDHERALEFSRRHPHATVVEQPIEGVELGAARFDWILLLRSYNHLEEPGAVLGRLAAALRPGAEMLVTDDVPFALVRSAEQARRAEGSGSRFEHYHGHDTADVLAALPRSLRAVEVSPVGPGTSNQWMVLCRKVREGSP